MSKKKTSKTKKIGKVAVGKRGAGKARRGDKKPKPGKGEKPDGKPKRTSALDAAAAVLQKANGPMNCKALIPAMAAQGLWSSPKGKTPAATLYAAMLREIGTKGATARFKKVDRGQFAFNADAAKGA